MQDIRDAVNIEMEEITMAGLYGISAYQQISQSYGGNKVKNNDTKAKSTEKAIRLRPLRARRQRWRQRDGLL